MNFFLFLKKQLKAQAIAGKEDGGSKNAEVKKTKNKKSLLERL